MITHSSIAFEDFLGSSIAPQVMPPCPSSILMTSSILQPSDLQSVFCGYWDANDLVLSSKGCRLNKEFSENEKTVCECFHLTRFDLIASLTLMFDNYLCSQLAHRYAVFFCSLDDFGSRVALLPRKFLRVRKVFARITEKNLLNCPNTFKTIRIFPDDCQFSR